MTAKKPTTDERIENMQTVVDGYKKQLAETSADMERYRKERTEAITNGREWKERAEMLEKEVGTLRDEIHGMTVEKARLEGYIDRAHESEPRPEPVMVTVPLETLRGDRNSKSDMDYMLRSYGSKDRPLPWYKRSI